MKMGVCYSPFRHKAEVFPARTFHHYRWINGLRACPCRLLSVLAPIGTGVVQSGEDIRFQEGDRVNYNFKVLAITKKEAPKFIFDIPKDFKKKDKKPKKKEETAE